MANSNNGSILGCYNTFLLIMDQFRHFNVLVVGDNPEELMAKYDSRNKVEKHIVYTFDNFNQLLNDINSFYNDDLLMNDSDVYIISAIAVDDGTYTLDQVMHGLEINNFRK